MMILVSVNAGLPRLAGYKGKTVTSGIFKHPVAVRVTVKRHNIEGDAQADLRVHGGAEKAVYAYPSEHHPFWQDRLGMRLGWGSFGENLTTEGIVEDGVALGDTYRIGTAVLKVTQPRQPCYKLAMKLERDDIVELFQRSGRSGFYFSIVEEGELGAGDTIHLVSKSPYRVSIADVNRLLYLEPENKTLLERVLAVPDLSSAQRQQLEKQRHRLRG